MEDWLKDHIFTILGVVTATAANVGAWLWKLAQVSKEIENLRASNDELREMAQESSSLSAGLDQVSQSLASLKRTAESTGENVIKLMVEMGIMGQAQTGLRDEIKSIRYELNRMQGEIDKAHTATAQVAKDMAELRGEHRRMRGDK